jgi:alpha-L-fucosidase
MRCQHLACLPVLLWACAGEPPDLPPMPVTPSPEQVRYQEMELAGFAEGARRHGVDVGLYLSPWDRNHPEYGAPAYVEVYREQLRELLMGYGEITEIWVDGANGGTGWYGGANEDRRIDRATYYQWPETMALAKSLQPSVLIFSDAGPDIRWIGNERGFAGETNWSTITTEGIVIGDADTEYLNRGDPAGTGWVVPLCNTSIRPRWFYHPSEDDRVKSPRELVDLYYRSVGRNCVLLLNVPADDSVTTATPEIVLDGPREFDRLLLQEPIRLGQRIAAFSVEARVDGEWATLAQGTTVGYKRLLRFPAVRADAVRIHIQESLAPPALSALGLYKSSPEEG